MNAKQYLKQAYRLGDLIKNDLQELKRLESLVTSVSSPNLTGIMFSEPQKHDAPFVNGVILIEELKEKINEEIKGFLKVEYEIRTTILNLKDNEQKLCLKLRYLSFLKWDAVASEMHISQKQVYRIHNQALKEIQKLIPNDTK